MSVTSPVRMSSGRVSSGCFGIARRALHEVAFLRLEDERQPEQQGGDQIDPEQLRGQHRQGDPGDDRDEQDQRVAASWSGGSRR